VTVTVTAQSAYLRHLCIDRVVWRTKKSCIIQPCRSRALKG